MPRPEASCAPVAGGGPAVAGVLKLPRAFCTQLTAREEAGEEEMHQAATQGMPLQSPGFHRGVILPLNEDQHTVRVSRANPAHVPGRFPYGRATT